MVVKKMTGGIRKRGGNTKRKERKVFEGKRRVGIKGDGG